jgi:hypothetical protein
MRAFSATSSKDFRVTLRSLKKLPQDVFAHITQHTTYSQVRAGSMYRGSQTLLNNDICVFTKDFRIDVIISTENAIRLGSKLAHYWNSKDAENTS